LSGKDDLRFVRSSWRSAVFGALLLGAVADGWVRKRVFGMRPGAEGAVWVSGWCRHIIRAMGLVCTLEGSLPEADERGLAVVSNHLSYLDILVYSAARPFVMVSKCEVRGWPLLGWITAQAGTVYVERADVKGGQTQTHAEVNRMMAEAFRSGLPVLFYPEGTTTSGETVLPFRRGLFNSVVYGRVPVKTAALSYELANGRADATVAEEVCFVGDAAFGPHLFRLLGIGGLKVRLKFGGEETAGEDRFALALNSRDSVVEIYEKLSGGGAIARQVPFPSQQRGNLFDRPIEVVGSVYGEVGAGG
jgi:1-acyl-sn-glycerol-3-phosphate acyltransferase